MLKLLALLWLLILLIVGGFLLFFGLQMPADFSMMPPVMTEPMTPESTIIDTAEADGRFTTLLAAVDAAGLRVTLEGEGPFTVFAPTDDAFAALPDGTVEALLEDIPTLSNILLYHAVAGEIYSDEVVMRGEITMLNGESVIITQDASGNVFINQAQIIITDIQASNGVIHVIDAVLIPTGE